MGTVPAMPKSRKRSTRKTRNIARFRQQVMQQTPLPVVQKQMAQAFPWLAALGGAERGEATMELAELTVKASGGDLRAAADLQSSIGYWQQVAELTSAGISDASSARGEPEPH